MVLRDYREKNYNCRNKVKINSPHSQEGLNFNIKDTVAVLQLHCGLDAILIKGCAYYTSLQGCL